MVVWKARIVTWLNGQLIIKKEKELKSINKKILHLISVKGQELIKQEEKACFIWHSSISGSDSHMIVEVNKNQLEITSVSKRFQQIAG